ncbi:MAG: Membrane protein involved in colicin uptake [Candidatus Saccharibacteria bacterium]|jgi:tetrahydromethanopterin S-methyltransferase subunit F|nr:Membrane protein involved in colicin uptake [Candidatus Saccharibacteria bacterium]
MNTGQEEKVTEVRESNTVQDGANVRRQSIATSQSVDNGVIARRIIYYIAGFIIALLALRLVLLLLAANQGAPFVDFVYALSGMFAWPFYGIFSYQPSYGQSTFEISTVVAIIVYALVAMGLAKLLTLTSNRTDV